MLDTALQTVLSLDDLQPSTNVNAAFTALVDAVVQADNHSYNAAVLTDVRARASDAETQLEIMWARRIIASGDPWATLAQFPYVDNYYELVRREIELVELSGLQLTSASRICMIGTGPLPMTAFELMKQRTVQVDHVDISVQALALCSLVGSRLGMACGHIGGDGASVALNRAYDCIIVAGLAGDTLADKQAIIDNVLPSLAPNGRLLVRSAVGARELLYPAIAARDVRGVQLLQEYHPDDDVINSVFVYAKA